MPKPSLSIVTFPTGFSYADRSRERGGDYVRLAFLPFDTLKLEWIAKRFSPELRAEILAHANGIAAREGQSYPVSASGQTVLLGGGRGRSHQSKSSTVPCRCGSRDARWHGPEDGLRQYGCDKCVPGAGAKTKRKTKAQLDRDITSFLGRRG